MDQEEIKKNLEDLGKSPHASDPDNQLALEEWQTALKDLQVRSDFANHDVTKEISAMLRKRIRQFTTKLAFAEDLDMEERKKAVQSRREDLWLLAVLNPNFESQMAALAEETRRALEEASS